MYGSTVREARLGLNGSSTLAHLKAEGSRELGPASPDVRRPDGESAWCRVSVVIPTLNEAANIRSVLNRVSRDVHEVIVVDGRSTDRTLEEVRRARPDALIVHQEGRGKGDALRLGFESATGDVIAMLDADGSMDPAEITRFVDAVASGADFVKGSRYLRPDGGSTDLSVVRDLGNRGLRLLVNLLYRTHYTDLCYGYNVFRASALDHVMPTCSGFEVETFMTIHASAAGLNVVEVPSFEVERHDGVSNLHAIRDGLRVVKTIMEHRIRLTGSRRRRDGAVSPTHKRRPAVAA